MDIRYKFKKQIRKIIDRGDFQKRIDSLSRKYKGKNVVLYGAGYIFEYITENYDLSGLNIVAVADINQAEEFKGYKAIKPNDIPKYNVDVILISSFWESLMKHFLKISALKDKCRDYKVELLINKTLWEKFEDYLVGLIYNS